MSTHKYIDRICAAAGALSLLLALLFCGGEALGLPSGGRTVGYENRLFDTARVHTLDIVMDGWDSFLDTCQNEEYSPCALVIDGEAYKNVGLRAKGNTSLAFVSRMDSDRYSFKVEFDHYEAGKSYHGLDKLCLNNLIQDSTMMKDYLTYRLMNSFGVDSPLCSFVYLTVNGEDWGLYLAVEGVEDAFLQRNYGGETGALYKPDSQNGDRSGAGKFEGRADGVERNGGPQGGFGPMSKGENGQAPIMPDTGSLDLMAMEEKGQPPAMPDPGGFDPGSGGEWAFGPAFGGGQMPDGGVPFGGQRFEGGAGGPGGGMGSSDVKLQYIDDDPDSYSNIFDNAKTDVSQADQNRLIAALKALSSYENLKGVLDVEEVLRYFVVHSFVVNGDSYTGSMIHNYYLYEEDGRLSMIPWDYNLAFGVFMGNSASSSVNDPIDDVLSDRPMQAWIFSDEAYTSQYHQLYAQFLDTADVAGIIDQACALIAPYVEKDPTKFCTYEEFQAGVEALKTFCALRTESVRGQLEGTIPSTTEGQRENSAALVDASGLNLSDLGSNTMGGGMGGVNPFVGGERDGDPDSESQPAFAPIGGRPGDFMPPGGGTQETASGNTAPILLAVSLAVLLGGLLFAFKFSR